jgi:LacI family transcriptional regulator
MQRRPTIIDVARAAGVSKSTVSLVLQSSPLVKDETRTQVKKAMTDIGYVYNRTAANLRSSNVGLIGLVINDLRNPFFTEFATSVQMALSARGYATVVANTDEDPVLQAQVVAAMIEHGVSGLVISPTYGVEDNVFDLLERAGVLAMQVLRKVDARTDRFPFAAPDYPAGSRMAADHLLQSGARRIAFVGGIEGRAVVEERMSGYLSALDDAGMQRLVLHGRASRSFGREAAHRLAAYHPDVDAAICFNDLVALGMLSGFAELGRPVGDGFRLVGFDDIEDCAQVWPTLTSVRCNIAGFGDMIAARLLNWIEDGVQPPPETRTSVDLMVRASSGGGA